jgi:alkanesulfonate monooxygenase SsuD/methylene tetrahydromethanopterin reductase-like flavin-dependent oxidoreductase (luciferase family)
VLTGLWSGKPFTYTGRQYTLKQTRFRPPPVQQPRIPIWVAGSWHTSTAPFRRAARWNGVCPERIKTPADVRAMAAYIARYRTSDAPFDIVRSAAIPSGTSAEIRTKLEPWAEAGVNWWGVGTTGRTGAFESMRQVIVQGPPQMGS